MYIVPTFQSTSARFRITAELAGSTFQLLFYWNAREKAWYMSIFNSEATLLLSGVKLVADYALLRQYRAIEGLPEGEFVLYDLESSPQTGPPTFESFGRRYQLIFLSQEEIENGVPA